MDINIKKVTGVADVVIPTYQTAGSAGVDLHATCEEATIQPNEIAIISTGICIELPLGMEAQVRPRSGLAAKHGISVLNTPGTIDSDYRGEIKVMLINHGHNEFTIRKGDRIAQMVFNNYVKVNLVPVEQLNSTERGGDGFGSTGK